ncbi:MAG: hypothetical protein KF752_06010 [Pirellulaceae bacterium]|nr:hypothetical protein [Pirellulaceae bacterium]
MSIQFSCTSCQHKLSVDNRLAGKTGKCPKCGQAVQVPKLKQNSETAPAAHPPTALSNVLDQLTESDFNRTSPFQSVYSPPKPKATNHELLNRAVQEEKKSKSKSKAENSIPVLIVLYSMQNIFQSLCMLLMVIVLLFYPATISEGIKYVPFVGAGVGTGAVLMSFMAAIMMLAGVGLPTKRLWGYIVGFSSYAFFAVIHAGNVIARTDDRNSAINAAIALVLAVFLSSYFVRKSCLQFFRIQSWTIPSMAAGCGLLLGLIVAGMYFVTGVYQPLDYIEIPEEAVP